MSDNTTEIISTNVTCVGENYTCGISIDIDYPVTMTREMINSVFTALGWKPEGNMARCPMHINEEV